MKYTFLKIYRLTIIFTFIFILFINLNSCKEDEILTPNIQNSLITITNINITVGDTVVLKGNFPKNNSLYSIILVNKNNQYKVSNQNIINSTISTIEFIYPYDFIGDSLYIVFNDKLDSTSKFHYNLKTYFDFDKKIIQTTNFKIGSDIGLNDESPVSSIFLSHKLEVSTFEINQRTWFSLMLQNNSSTKNLKLAVDSITWIDAILFCNKLSTQSGLKEVYKIQDTTNQIVIWNENTDGWRLPTEAEWEFLAKGNTSDDTFQNKPANEVGWFLSNSGGRLNQSGLKLANINGLYDMNGNVWEWCWDNYQAGHYTNLNNSKNPKGPNDGKRKVKRGGSFRTGSFLIRASNRTIDDEILDGTGLRIVRNLNFD